MTLTTQDIALVFIAVGIWLIFLFGVDVASS